MAPKYIRIDAKSTGWWKPEDYTENGQLYFGILTASSSSWPLRQDIVSVYVETACRLCLTTTSTESDSKALNCSSGLPQSEFFQMTGSYEVKNRVITTNYSWDSASIGDVCKSQKNTAITDSFFFGGKTHLLFFYPGRPLRYGIVSGLHGTSWHLYLTSMLVESEQLRSYNT